MNHKAKTALRVYGTLAGLIGISALAGLIGISAVAGPALCNKMMSADLDNRSVTIETIITELNRQEFHIKARDRGEIDGRKAIDEAATQVCPKDGWLNKEIRIVTDRPWHRGTIIYTR